MPTKIHVYVTIVVAASISVLVASSARADGLAGLTPAEEYRGSIETVRETLAPHRTLTDISAFVGNTPARCQGVPRGASICVWHLGSKESGWRALAKVLRTGDRLNLVCELPPDESPRGKDSCSVHSQRSNRTYYRREASGAERFGRPTRRLSGAMERLAVEAKQHLAGLRTAFELSTLMGDAPSECRSEPTRVHCSWRGTSGTYGHGTLAMSIGADMSKKVRLNCALPADGTPRAPDSCTVNIGG